VYYKAKAKTYGHYQALYVPNHLKHMHYVIDAQLRSFY